jgi:hypothetical protein
MRTCSRHPSHHQPTSTFCGQWPRHGQTRAIHMRTKCMSPFVFFVGKETSSLFSRQARHRGKRAQTYVRGVTDEDVAGMSRHGRVHTRVWICYRDGVQSVGHTVGRGHQFGSHRHVRSIVQGLIQAVKTSIITYTTNIV